ncbi:hypothetical protein C4M98_06745, partial [Mycoplasmopsis pullorum]
FGKYIPYQRNKILLKGILTKKQMNLTKKQKMHVAPTVKNTWAKIRSGLEQFGRAMILPVSIIPVLAIIGALGYILQTVGNKTG